MLHVNKMRLLRSMCSWEANLHFLKFVVCVRATGKVHAHRFESRWEVGVIKAFDKKGPHAGKGPAPGRSFLEGGCYSKQTS